MRFLGSGGGTCWLRGDQIGVGGLGDIIRTGGRSKAGFLGESGEHISLVSPENRGDGV